MHRVSREYGSRRSGLIGRSLGVVFLALTITACAGASNQEIASFAQSGVTFSGQIPRVYDFAFQQAVERDNTDLLRNRERLRKLQLTGPQLTAAKTGLEQQYDANLQEFEQRLESFRIMKEHASTLGAYFVSLNALASGASSEAAGNAANGLVTKLGGLAPQVKTISFGGAPVADLVGPLAKLAVASFTNARLQEHLKTHAGTVQEAVALQRTMFELLLEIERDREKIPADVGIKQSLLNLDKDLPPDWARQRQQSFTFQLQPNPISVALSAAKELESNFNQLVEGGQGALASLERSIVFVETVVTIYEANRQGASQ